jgi:hypothetical protein
LGEHLVFFFTWYLDRWEPACIHFYVVFGQLGSNLCQFLCGIPLAGSNLYVFAACMCFMWYSDSLWAICMHLYVVLLLLGSSLYVFLRGIPGMGSNLYAFLRGIRIAGGPLVCIFN